MSAADWDTDRIERGVVLPDCNPDERAFICIRGLHRWFGPRHILRGIDLDVEHGETVAILGLSGSGKTTLFRHLMGTLRVQKGSIHVDGQALSTFTEADWNDYRLGMGVVFQNAALLGSLTIEQNVGLPLTEVDRLPKATVRQRVIHALLRVFLPAEEILHLKPPDLSGGMRKRVGIARAIIREPALLLYDEPTTGLDPVTVSAVNELTLELQRRLGVTSVVITHDLDAAFKIADRIAMLYKGRIIAFGTPDEIRQSDHPVLEQLLSGSVRGPLTEAYTEEGVTEAYESRNMPRPELEELNHDQ